MMLQAVRVRAASSVYELCGVLVGWEGLQWAAWYAKTALAAFFVVFRCLDIAPNVEVKTGQTT